MSIASTDEQRAADDALKSWGAGAVPLALSRAQENDPGRWRECWAELANFGLFAVAVPAARGGLGGTVTDLAVLLEQSAALLVPGPVLSSALAGLVLSRTDTSISDGVLTAVAGGSRPAAVALEAGTVTASPAGADLVLTGQVGPVLGATPDAVLIVAARSGERDVWVLLDAK